MQKLRFLALLGVGHPRWGGFEKLALKSPETHMNTKTIWVTTISSLPPTRLSLDAIRVPGSAFYFVSSLEFMVGYLFVNASQGVGDEIDVTPIFFSIHAGFRAF